jgi:hypothetical protein
VARHPRLTHSSGYKQKKMRVEVYVSRTVTATSGKPAFRACAGLASGGRHTYVPCSTGRNPRVAAASVLRRLAGQIATRKGAFAGYSKLHRRTRRTRRGMKRR